MRLARSGLVALVATVTLAGCPIQPTLPTTPTPYVHLVPTCNVREFRFDVQYAGWYALLADLGGVPGIFQGTTKYRRAGERVTIYMELPFIPFRIGWSADGGEPWITASNTVTGWDHCI